MDGGGALSEHAVINGGDVVLIEDNNVDADRIVHYLQQGGGVWEIRRAATLADGLALLETRKPDLVLLDLALPDAHGLETISAVLAQVPHCLVVIQSAARDDQVAIEAIRLGAQDFLRKEDLSRGSLQRSVSNAMTRHRARDQLEAAAAEIADRDSELDDFSHVVAHDLRSPLRTARLLADRLLAQIESDDPLANELGSQLDKSLSRMDTMVCTMLEYTGLRAEFSDPEPVSLYSVVDAVRASLEADLLASGAEVVMSPLSVVQVFGRADLLERVIANLFGNAIKYRRPDVRLLIRFGMSVSAQTVTLSLSDNGIGVPAADRERAFNILSRLNPGAASGLGFGLAICRRIIKGLGGEIWIEPSDDAGTTVLVRLRRSPDTGEIQR